MTPLIGACAVSTPLRGPGFGPELGVTAPGNAPLVAAVTLAQRGRDAEANRRFWSNVETVRASLDAQPGFVAHSIRRELLGNRAWTLTVWENAASLDAFVRSPDHARAMASSARDLTAMRFVRFSVPRTAMPVRWEDALAALDQTGRAYGPGEYSPPQTPPGANP